MTREESQASRTATFAMRKAERTAIRNLLVHSRFSSVLCIPRVDLSISIPVRSSRGMVGALPVLEKILEKHLHSKISKYLDAHCIIPNFQHGFQKNKSTYTLLEEVAELINPALDTRMYAVIIAVDLKLAFDTISHDQLVRKFQDIGIQNQLISNYFQNRKQRTKID